MPFYELVMLCKVGESAAMGTLIKNVSAAILQEGGVVRGFENLGDRIIAKNLKAKDGNKYGVGRYIAVEFDGSPRAVQKAINQALINTETLKTYVHKISEQDYVKRTMKRLNQEMSPLRDASTKDPGYLRDMWQEYTRNASFESETRPQQIRRSPE